MVNKTIDGALKVATFVGTRPEIIKLSRVISKLDAYCEHILIHTGQNYDYELNQIFFDDMKIRKPDYFLDTATGNPAKTIANIISKSDEILEDIKPDAILIYGDTNSCLCVISAKRRKIPIFHMEAGNRCFDERVPEEINRKIVDHLSDINMPLTEHARRYLIAEGIRQDSIIKTGSCMQEVFDYYSEQIEASDILDRLDLKRKNYFLASIHREENLEVNDNFFNLIEMLNAVAERYNMQIIVSTHPRTMNKLKDMPAESISPLIKLNKPFGFFDYVKLQKESFCILSDSGTITEEASLLGTASVMLRMAHERPEGMDKGVLVMSGIKNKAIFGAIEVAVSSSVNSISKHIPEDYMDDNVSEKVVKIIYSYTDYINRTVWKK